MRHTDMPPMGLGVATPTPEVDAWQAAHEPILSLALWVCGQPGADHGAVLVKVRWADDVVALEMSQKPYGDMLAALRQAAAHIALQAEAIVRAAQMVETLSAVEGNN